MRKTVLTVSGRDFYLNGRRTYSDHPGCDAEGLLMNARFVQAIFDDRHNRSRYNRFGRSFNPERNTDALIAALPQWYAYGLRAITIGLQGGGPCFTTENKYIDNNPFSPDGTEFDEKYRGRLLRLLTAADEIGMAVIVSCFYEGQLHRLLDETAVKRALLLVCRMLRTEGFTNCIIEPCNEYNIARSHKIVSTDGGMAELLAMVRRESGFLCGCSGTGGYFSPVTAKASDVVFLHGNGLTRNKLHQLIERARLCRPDAPILINEDSQDLTNLSVCVRAHASWGYYNNWTKQEPPADWRVTDGEDRFFAERVAETAGLLPENRADDYRLMGMEKDLFAPLDQYGTMQRRIGNWMPEFPLPTGDMRFLRLAALYPEHIDYVEFYADGTLIDTVYDAPFLVRAMSNWAQAPVTGLAADARVYAVVHERTGRIVRVDAL